jgi:predicted DNA-binding transcriptional regulator AlpA
MSKIREAEVKPLAVPAVPDPTGSTTHTFQFHINIRQAAHFLGVAEGTVYHWVSRSPRAGDPIPFVKLSPRCLRFPARDLETWAARRRNGRITAKAGKGGVQ